MNTTRLALDRFTCERMDLPIKFMIVVFNIIERRFNRTTPCKFFLDGRMWYFELLHETQVRSQTQLIDPHLEFCDLVPVGRQCDNVTPMFGVNIGGIRVLEIVRLFVLKGTQPYQSRL